MYFFWGLFLPILGFICRFYISIVGESRIEDADFFLFFFIWCISWKPFLADIFIVWVWLIWGYFRDGVINSILLFNWELWPSALEDLLGFLVSFFQIEVKTEVKSFVAHHSGFGKVDFHLVTVCLDFNALAFLDFLSARGLSGAIVSRFMRDFTWWRTLACLKRSFGWQSMWANFWPCNRGLCWRRWSFFGVVL